MRISCQAHFQGGNDARRFDRGVRADAAIRSLIASADANWPRFARYGGKS